MHPRAMGAQVTAWAVVLVAVGAALAGAVRAAPAPGATPAFLYFDGLPGGDRPTLYLAWLEDATWRTRKLVSARGLQLVEPLAEGWYLLRDWADRWFIFRPDDGKQVTVTTAWRAHLVGLSPERRRLVFSFPLLPGVELRVFHVDRGWDESPLGRIGSLEEVGMVRSNTRLWATDVVAVSPNCVRYAFFCPTESHWWPTGPHTHNLWVGELPLGWARVAVRGIRCANSGFSSMMPEPVLLWIDDRRILYQHAVAVSEPGRGEALGSSERWEQTLRLVDVVTGKELFVLRVPGSLGQNQRLWREWPGGDIHYQGAGEAREYIVDLAGKRLIPITDVVAFYTKGMKVRVRYRLFGEQERYCQLVWDGRAGRAITPAVEGRVDVIASRDGRFAAFVAGGELSVYDRQTRRTQRLAQGDLWLARWMP